MASWDPHDWWVRGRLVPPDDVEVVVTGHDPVLGARHHSGEAAAAALALVGARVAASWAARAGEHQVVRVDVAEAATTLLSFFLQQAEHPPPARDPHRALVDLYPTADGRWLHLHGGFPHLADRLMAILGLTPERGGDPAAVADAVSAWDGGALEDAIAESGACGALVRSADEWARHPQGRAVEALPVVAVERLGDAPPRPWPSPVDDRPLAGIRVLDLTRVLAGPTCGRTLAAWGAEVLRVSAEHLPSIELFVMDTGPGKRNCYLDLRAPADLERFRALVREADVVVSGYRVGALAGLGLDRADLLSLRPDLVLAQVSCYGSVGPWAERRGWEQLAQSVSGIAHDEGSGGTPKLIAAAVTDYTTGYLAAAGVVDALDRRASVGGAWSVDASLCQTAHWLVGGGHDLDPGAATGLGEVDARMQTFDTQAWGAVRRLAPAVHLAATPARWDLPPAALGSSRPGWR